MTMNLNQAITLVSGPTQAEFVSKEIFYHGVVVSGLVRKTGDTDIRIDLNLETNLAETLEVLGFENTDDLTNLTLDQVQRFINNLARFIKDHDLTTFGYTSLTETVDNSDDEDGSADEYIESSDD